MLKIAAWAEAYYTPLAPHCANTVLGLSANMHAIAAVPLFLIHETNPDATPKGLVHAEWKDHNDGYVGLPSGPGLRVEVDERNSSGYQHCHPSGSGQSTAGSRMARRFVIERSRVS